MMDFVGKLTTTIFILFIIYALIPEEIAVAFATAHNLFN